MGSLCPKPLGLVTEEDQVIRKERFCERHPEIRVYVDDFGFHRAACDTHEPPIVTVGYYWLKHLLDHLERFLDQ